MAAQNRIILFLLLLNNIGSSYFLGTGTFLVKRLENCDQNENYTVKFNVTFKTVGDKQYIDGSLVLTAQVDNHIRSNVSVDTLIGEQYVYLLSINERKSCDALNKYFGELLYDLERNSQIIPGLCPIAKGRYQVHNSLLDFGKMTVLKNLPIGNLRFTCMSYDATHSVVTCLQAEVENRI